MTASFIPPIDLNRQHASMQGEVEEAIARVMASGRFISGPETKAFEQEYAAYCGTEHAIGLGSGSAALNLTLKALGIGEGDEVITVAFTLSATLDAIVELGATPVLVDVTEDTYTMDASQVAAKVKPRTKAVLPVNIYGHPADIDAIAAAAPGLPIIVDACESHGASYKGKPATMAGTASCFSFYPTKNLSALGDAGGVATSDAALADRVRMLHQHGWDRRFHSLVSSLNSRMDEIHAAVLRAKLPRLDGWNRRRAEIAREYDAAIKGTSIVPASKADWAEPSYYLYVARTQERDRLRAEFKDRNISTDVYWPETPHLQPAFADLGYRKGSLPVTERLCDEVVSLPMFPELTADEVERVCSALRGFA
jgi:dTDP-3-amino-3,4,6-trideoxy-alpha-D-glucose transaminase